MPAPSHPSRPAFTSIGCVLLATAIALTGCNAFDEPSDGSGADFGEDFGFPDGRAGGGFAQGGSPGIGPMMGPPSGFCGNGILEGGEQCDRGAGLDEVTCEKLGFAGGVVGCDGFCRLSTADCFGGMSECPTDPGKADGAACFTVDQRCSYPPSCGGAECTCEPDADDQDAGVEADEDGGADDAPELHWRCAIRPC